jgi:aryl-alcohol dehydrogenase-like predicted oxidoreductase
VTKRPNAWPRAREASFEDQVATLAELRKEGLIRHIGLSNVTPHRLHAALQITEIAAVTAYFNVAARQNAALQKAASAAGTVFCPRQPVSLIQPGFKTDTTGPQAIRRTLEPIATRHGATVPQWPSPTPSWPDRELTIDNLSLVVQHGSALS